MQVNRQKYTDTQMCTVTQAYWYVCMYVCLCINTYTWVPLRFLCLQDECVYLATPSGHVDTNYVHANTPSAFDVSPTLSQPHPSWGIIHTFDNRMGYKYSHGAVLTLLMNNIQYY